MTRRCTVALALITFAAVLVGAGEPPEGVSKVFMDAARVQISGAAQTNGGLEFTFQPQEGEAKVFVVKIMKGMKAKEIAKDVYKELVLAAGGAYKVSMKGATIIRIRKADKKGLGLSLAMSWYNATGVGVIIVLD